MKRLCLSPNNLSHLVLLTILSCACPSAWAQKVYQGAGNSATTAALNSMRADIGGADNSLTPTAQSSGRREINWDAVRLDGTDFNGNNTSIIANKITGIAKNRFQARGILFDEIYAVANDGFVSANPGVTGQFLAFSPANTFMAFNETTLEMNFILASAPTTTPVPAATRSFGVIFLDVETANSSSIEYFNGNVSLGKYFVPPGPSGEAEFLGVRFNAPIITRVVVTAGAARVFGFANGQTTPGVADQTVNALSYTDLAVTDDFIYDEPLPLTVHEAAKAFAVSGAPAAVTPIVEAYRAAIGGADNSLNATPQASGRREINWDAVRLDGTDFNSNTTVLVPGKITGIPVNRFQARGARFNRVLAVANDGFASANPTIAGQFPAFSPANTFCSFNVSKETSFVLASAPTTTPVPASTRGFGAIFLDVEKEHTSSIEYFNGSVSLGKFFVPVGRSGETQFLGVLFPSPVVTRVVLTTGNAEVFTVNNGQVVSGGPESETKDLVMLDDFFYAEPVLNAVSVSSASYSGAALASDTITSVFGNFWRGEPVIANTIPLPTDLNGTKVSIRDSAGTEKLAPLFFTSIAQINYLTPSGLANGDALITITNTEGRRATGVVKVENVAPGLFSANSSGQGVAAATALRVRNGSELIYEPIATFDTTLQRFVSKPIDLGPANEAVYLILYGTGIRNHGSLSRVTAKLGNTDAQVLYGGWVEGLAGLDQVNVWIPKSLIGAGEIDVVLTVDGKTANTVRVNIK